MLHLSASNYLKNEPSAWMQFSGRVSAGIRAVAVTQYDISANHPLIRALGQRVTEALLDPELVRWVAECSDEEQAVQRLTLFLNSHISEQPLVHERSPLRFDFSDSSVEGSSPIEWEEHYGFLTENPDLPQGLVVYSTVPMDVDQNSLVVVIRDAVVDSVDPTPHLIIPSVRLDVIDTALYKALIQHPDLMHSLNWRVYERLLADILESFGYEIELQQGTKDGGVDIFAVRRSDPLGEHRYLLQAKRWKNKVGVEPVRQLAFLHNHHRVSKSCLATTAKFTSGAWNLAKQYRWQLELRDIDGIREWLKMANEVRSKSPGNTDPLWT
jgi:hypothetical protein